MLHAVIMAGGSGTRFWPLSRQSRPKQLLSLAGDESLLQATVARVAGLIPAERTWIVTNAAQREETARQASSLAKDHLIAEPCGRNTAPCIGLAAIQLLAEDPDAVMLVMPADHVIANASAFQSAVRQAGAIVERAPDTLMLFGVKPTYPATGFGYIERGEALGESGAFHVRAFREKPDRATAEKYVAAGTFYWNCGLFVWRADRILRAIAEFEPSIHAQLVSLQSSIGAADWPARLAAEFPQMKSISIDYAVLERDSHVAVLEAPFDWDDAGSWQAIPRLRDADASGNTVRGLHTGLDTNNCVIETTGEHLIATAGVDGLIIVHTPDATLIARKDDENSVKQLVDRLRERGLERFL